MLHATFFSCIRQVAKDNFSSNDNSTMLLLNFFCTLEGPFHYNLNFSPFIHIVVGIHNTNSPTLSHEPNVRVMTMDFKIFNKATKKNPYVLPFFDEVLIIVAWYEAHSFLDGYLGYHHISITPKDRSKITFVTDWGAFVCMVMPFGVRKGPPNFQKVVSKAFKKYLNQFMTIFLDDFRVYSDMENHLMKFRLYFQKCEKYKISLNPEKCAFMVFLGLILGFIISKEGKIPNPKKVQAIANVLVPTNPQQI